MGVGGGGIGVPGYWGLAYRQKGPARATKYFRELGTPSSLDEEAQGIPKNQPLSESNPSNAVI